MAAAIKSAVSSVIVGKPALVELKPYLQPFPYGREGYDSMAARFAKSAIPETEIKDGQPYGEIWLGSTHKNGPSKIMGRGTALRDLIYSDPEFYLGKELLADADMQEMYKDDLPFLFKILSFDKALPLQAHPDPKLGQKLKNRELRKQWYNSDFVDENGKPEVSVALSDFSAFVGFRPPSHIHAFAKEVPEFGHLLGDQQIDSLARIAQAADVKGSAESRDALKSVFGTLIAASASTVTSFIGKITDKQSAQGAQACFGNNKDADALAKIWTRNLEVFGKEDVGVIITAYCMNLLQLKAGQGCWILADDIHAYVEGDVIECMANSDNMVCHGLGDTEQGGIRTFTDMLSYRHLPAPKLELEYKDSWEGGKQGNTRLYKVPIEEFDLLAVTLDDNNKTETLTLTGPHTFVVTEGTIKAKVEQEEIVLEQGHTAFVKANATLELEHVTGPPAKLWGSFWQKKQWFYEGA